MEPAQSLKRPRASRGVLALILAGSLLAIWWVIVRPTSPNEGPPPIHPPIIVEKSIPPGLSKSEFYQRDLVPLLEKAHRQNQLSADRAIARIHEDFDRFRAGIPNFSDDVTSWSTRFGVVGRMTKDKWKNIWKNEIDPNSEEVKKYMLEKFESQIMSRDALHRAVESALIQFKDDITANRNLLLREMKMALRTNDVPLDFSKPDFDAFQRDFNDHVAKSVGVQANVSVENAVVTFVASSAGTWAAEQLVAQVIRILAAQAMTAGVEAAAVGGSSMAGGGAIGGSAGWLGGPAGEVIAVGVGLVIGAIIDWWLTDKFKANLAKELTSYLDNLESEMTRGVVAKGDRPAQTGLLDSLRNAADQVSSIQEAAVLHALEEAE